jgi:hypothetical protein
MLLIGSRLSRLFPVIGFATLILITTTAQVLSQTPILLMFADGSAQLDQQSNALALAALAGVISHHGTRPGLRVWLMGAAPLDCSTRPCHGDRLLKRRVEGAVSALVGSYPADRPTLVSPISSTIRKTSTGPPTGAVSSRFALRRYDP